MSGGGAHFSATYFPTTEDHPRAEIHSEIAVVRLSSTPSYQSVTLQWSPGDEKQALQYLRELVAAATDLADEIERTIDDREQQVTEAVLGS